MKFRLNLGNTLDTINWEKKGDNGLDLETCMGDPEIKEEMFEILAKKDIKTVRIPATWKII